MEYHVERTLRRLGHQVTPIAALSGQQLVAELTNHRPDVVFNATEHMYRRRTADLQIASLLELLRLPYTGATPAALLLSRDKAASKALAAKVGVRVPEFALAPIGELDPIDVPPFPVVVKPVSNDSSEGITLRSLVRTRGALAQRIRIVHRSQRDSAIIESFIDGTDTYVFALEGRTLQIRAPHELIIDANGDAARSMATYHVKHDQAYRSRWRIRSRPAKLSAKTLRELRQSVRRLWPVLQLRDYARIDFRVTPNGEPYFIEANANPGFSPASRSDRWSAADYEAAVRQVIANAIRRAS
jgi:D-alanine-D-alanine ligase